MIKTYTVSETGGHPLNEDAFLVQQSRGDAESWLVCVADGQGGRAGGGRAAQLACQTLASSASVHLEALSKADTVVAADPEAGFTTFVAAVVVGDKVIGASSGDSALLALCGSGKTLELTAKQIKNPPVGSGNARFVPFDTTLVRPWRLLAMTDGVWKYVGWGRIRDLSRQFDGEALLAELQTAARLPRTGQFQDDFTAVLIEAT